MRAQAFTQLSRAAVHPPYHVRNELAPKTIAKQISNIFKIQIVIKTSTDVFVVSIR